MMSPQTNDSDLPIEAPKFQRAARTHASRSVICNANFSVVLNWDLVTVRYHQRSRYNSLYILFIISNESDVLQGCDVKRFCLALEHGAAGLPPSSAIETAFNQMIAECNMHADLVMNWSWLSLSDVQGSSVSGWKWFKGGKFFSHRYVIAASNPN
jgi:hypothetical protein